MLARIISALALAAAATWLWFEPKFDSLVATLVTASALAVVLIAPKLKAPRQAQSVDGGSTGIQAGGDVNIANTNAPQKDSKNAQ